MVERNESRVVVGVFRDRVQAERAVEELHRAGYDENNIGFASPGDEDTPEGTSKPSEATMSGEGAGVGVGVAGGGVLGGALGAVASGVIPGIGPIIAVGALTGIIGGAAIGGAAGGVAGALTGMGVSEDEAEVYEEEFRAGRSIVSVQPEEGNQAEVRTILERHGAYDAHTRET
jgi:hypothetical protein